jgi:hypothetical protein
MKKIIGYLVAAMFVSAPAYSQDDLARMNHPFKVGIMGVEHDRGFTDIVFYPSVKVVPFKINKYMRTGGVGIGVCRFIDDDRRTTAKVFTIVPLTLGPFSLEVVPYKTKVRYHKVITANTRMILLSWNF